MSLKRIFWLLFFAIIVSLLVWGWVFVYKYIFDDLPEISMETLVDIPEKTAITDRDWNVLYNFFEEDRTYVEYEDIPRQVIHAFLSSEDRNYRDHEWIDWWGVIRAVINNLEREFLNKDLRLQWASTITQQLIKNIYLTNERTLKRKIQELITTRKVYKLLWKNYTDEFSDATDEEIDIMVKKKILEIYLNLIFLWNNSYGIETASRRYFNKSLQDISLFEAALLWWLPQAPSSYNPLTKRKKAMGSWKVEDGEETYLLENTWELTETFEKLIKDRIIKKIETTKIDLAKPNRITEFWQDDFENNNTTYTYTYTPGRKDYVLRAMYQEGHISANQLLDAFVEGVDYTFSRYSYNISAPHFVFYVKELLINSDMFDEIDLTEDKLLKWWYTIQTSLDADIQSSLEKTWEWNIWTLNRYWWSSRSALHLNSTNWDILGYLWSLNYFDAETDGQYDLIHARRQQWSSLKPFIFAKLFETFPLKPSSSIIDEELDVWNSYTPGNSDGTFRGMMTMSKALNNSRNLPAIRALYAIGWESVVKPFLQSLWLSNIKTDHPYWYTLTLWSAEESLYNLWQAYLQLSSPHSTVPRINPILSIKDRHGKTIYSKDWENVNRIIPRAISKQLRNMLTKREEVNNSRRHYTQFEWIPKYAYKSGTSDTKRWGVTYPKDWYITVYTPKDTIITWAWNIDSKPLWPKGLWSVINKDFMQSYIDELWVDFRGYDEWYFWNYHEWDEDTYAFTTYSDVSDWAANVLWYK